MNKLFIWIIVSILIVYFVFTSGLVFEVSKTEITGKIDIPYSIGLSAERTGVANTATQDDINCLNWLNKNWDGESAIVGDYNTYCLITGYLPNWFLVVHHDRVGDIDYFPDRCYIFISSWNTRHQLYVEAITIGARKSYPLPGISYPLIYQSGDAKIYFKRPPSTGG